MTGFVNEPMIKHFLRFPWLRVGYWVHSHSRSQIKTKIRSLAHNLAKLPVAQQKSILRDLMIGCFYIRDIRHGLGRRDVSRWMFLELERQYPGFLIMCLPYLHSFGYWKDFNLILQDIHQDPVYRDLEGAIYCHLETRILADIAAYNSNHVNSISMLAKYIGKERGALDRQTGFARRFANQLYQTESIIEYSQDEINNKTRDNLKKYRFMIATLRPFACRYCSTDPVLMDCEKLDSTQNPFRVCIYNFKDVFQHLINTNPHYKNLPSFFETKSDPNWFWTPKPGVFENSDASDASDEETENENNKNTNNAEVSVLVNSLVEDVASHAQQDDTLITATKEPTSPTPSTTDIDDFVVIPKEETPETPIDEKQSDKSDKVLKTTPTKSTESTESTESTTSTASSGWFSWFF